MDHKTPSKYRLGVTWRAIIIGLLLMPVITYWVFTTEVVRYQGHPTTISIFYSSIFVLLLLIAFNGFLKRYFPRYVCSQGELITIYVMLNISSALAGHDSIQVLVGMMPYAAFFATPSNQWNTLFVNRTPGWLVVKDPAACKNFFFGGSSIYTPANFGAWIVPVFWWSLFVIVLVLMFLCLNVLLRKQWTEREKLSYPLVQLPLDMTSEDGSLFRNKLLWYGFAVAAVIDIVNGIHMLYPQIPQLPIKLGDQAILFTTRPWNAILSLPVNFYPFGIGLGMLLPVDLLFSCWFFFWVWKAQAVLTAVFGLETIKEMPFVFQQSFGAYMGISAFAIVVSRRHLVNIFRHFIGRKTDIDDSEEPISYNAAVWFLILGAIFLTVFSMKAGLSPWLLIPFWVLYFGMCIAITRLRAELGPPAHDLHYAGPDRILPAIIGQDNVGVRGLNALALFHWFNRAYRSHPMPFQLEGFKMAERTRMSYRGLFVAMTIATVAGTVVAFWVILHIVYQKGAATSNIGPGHAIMAFGREPWVRLESLLKIPQLPDTNGATAVLVGFFVTIILNSLRLRVGWFPLHPVGYAVSSSWSMEHLWAAMFIAWIIKLLTLRYGGLKLYRCVLPFFLGVILGECAVGSLWTIYGIVFHVKQTYAFWP
ncbi:MAG: hypothetical protein A2Z18_07725 [Armatimonadetes bacterium RBG_16_58_9]|nr:MAG: hypothetical protein A2Z18_07725 [Armatimonadetes bacterium RBG_16_58_9]